MSEKKTIAIQADDPNFITRYEERVKQSGKTVKNYLMGLIWGDINNPDQAFATAPTHSINMSPLFDDPELYAQFQARLGQSGKSQEEYLVDLIRADTSQVAQAVEAVLPQDNVEVPAINADITHLFVKITKEQREALELRKNETGETVGKILNRLIDSFLDLVRNEGLAGDFDETYRHYEEIAGECDTTCSAKIPSQINNELHTYLESTGKSRNVLMACLIQMELDGGQSMEEEQEEGQGMAMQL